MGYLLLPFNQISNNCGMLHHTSGGQFKIPIVIQGPGGVGLQLGAEHSQCLGHIFSQFLESRLLLVQPPTMPKA
ncbi:Pyruvate dehydrogenase E1 component subunit beta-3, chloroplastic [Capsicum baccatum]|uniref:pyruvate dehydrogenase (acetyl-transferring) n=1 Tax=Capsicum baccatum TaxID=33114 RepID=A0A2G2WY79_CAPBA|nr:Pyruvate dehydrogenase E1 component subunit beta-3, chloroplastic [Capsicum baccatum]